MPFLFDIDTISPSVYEDTDEYLKSLQGYDANKVQILNNNKGTFNWSNTINGGTAIEL